VDIKKAFDEKKAEFSDLQKRIDTDADLVNLSKYILKDIGGHPVPRAISITLNDPAVFAASVEASLGNASEQVAVETENKKLDTAYIEDVVKALFTSADYRRSKQGEFPLNSVFDQMMSRRGGGAARCTVKIENEQLLLDITPWDRRYFYYGMGPEGLAWVGYETQRDKDSILTEYPDAKITGKGATVLDLWDAEQNVVYIGGKKHFEQENLYGVVPVCFQLVPMGSMLYDKDYLQYRGESIFFLIRDLVPELNRLVSLIQSLNQKELDHALMVSSKEGKGAKPPAYADLTTPGSVVSVDEGTAIQPITFGQLRQQAWLLHSMIEIRVQRGSLSNFDYGTFSQPMSAVALIKVGEGRDQLFLPRLGARGLLKQQIAFMLLDQIIQLGGSVEIGVKGHKRTFDVKKLEGEYNIQFRYFIKSPAIDIARYQTATAAIGAGITSRKTARREIAQLEDPDEEERRIDWEQVGELIPAIKLRRQIESLHELADRGDEGARLDAELAEETLINLIGQSTQPPPTSQTSEGILPLLAKELGSKTAAEQESTAQEAANLRRIPGGKE